MSFSLFSVRGMFLNLSMIFWRAVPALMVLTAYLLLDHPFIESLRLTTTKALPYYLSGALLFISLTFNRSRLALAAINVCLAYAFIQNGLQSTLQQAATLLLYQITVIVFCLNLCLIALYQERGSLSFWGIVRLLWVFLSYLPFWWLIKYGQVDALLQGFPAATLPHSLLSLGLPLSSVLHPPSLLASITGEMLAERPWITGAWLISFFSSGLVLSLIALFRRSSIEFALMLTWLTGLLVFFDFARPDISVFLFSVLTIALFVAFIQITYDLAYVDTLTELPGRRALLEKLGTLSGTYTIAMLDVDHFKKFNDTYGHDVGDQVLKLVASQIRQVKGRGSTYRYGGEEFTLVFPRKNTTQVAPFLDELREAIAQYPMVIRDPHRAKSAKSGSQQRGSKTSQTKSVHITVSIGAAEHSGTLRTPEDVMERADKALYQSKKAGRNCVTCLQKESVL